jgi:GT2 family glycosyltransferase
MMRTALVLPSLGAPSLESSLLAVEALRPAPDEVLLVLSGEASRESPTRSFSAIRFQERLGFTSAVNAGLDSVLPRADLVGLLNDDAIPDPGWLGRLTEAIGADPSLAAVQGTVTDAEGDMVDGRGILINRWGLAEQVDRGRDVEPEPELPADRTAVSATAAVFRAQALRGASLDGGRTLDPAFDSYHEDVDLGLRLMRLGWRSRWVPGARCRHLGSSTGLRLPWRYPWWLLANPWRVVAGNLRPWPSLRILPGAAWGELRALPRLSRRNPRTPLVALGVAFALPVLLAKGWRRVTPGRRLRSLPVETP